MTPVTGERCAPPSKVERRPKMALHSSRSRRSSSSASSARTADGCPCSRSSAAMRFEAAWSFFRRRSSSASRGETGTAATPDSASRLRSQAQGLRKSQVAHTMIPPWYSHEREGGAGIERARRPRDGVARLDGRALRGPRPRAPPSPHHLLEGGGRLSPSSRGRGAAPARERRAATMARRKSRYRRHRRAPPARCRAQQP
jgi:hypothetical protein